MMRFSMFLLVLVLFGAAAGRYKAEAEMRAMRHEISDLETARAAALSEITLLAAEVAYLEGPERLALIAENATNLRPVSVQQLMSTEEFLAQFSPKQVARPDDIPAVSRDAPVNQGEEGPNRVAIAELATR